MASKAAIIKLLEEKTTNKIISATKECRDAMDKVGIDLAQLEKNIRESLGGTKTVTYTGLDGKKGNAEMEFITPSYLSNVVNRKSIPEWQALTEAKVLLEKERQRITLDIRTKSDSIRETIILSGIPDNIRELLAKL